MIRITDLALSELFNLIFDGLKVQVTSIDADKCVCDININADFQTINRMPTMTIVHLGIRNLKTAQLDKYNFTIPTNSYKEIILS